VTVLSQARLLRSAFRDPFDALKVRLAPENKARLDLCALPKPLCPEEKNSCWIPE
jgi:hypothetical protein